MGSRAAAHDHRFHRLIPPSINLLMRHKRRHVDEVARPGFVDELQPLAPAQARATADDIEDRLQLPMMMGGGASRGPALSPFPPIACPRRCGRA